MGRIEGYMGPKAMETQMEEKFGNEVETAIWGSGFRVWVLYHPIHGNTT